MNRFAFFCFAVIGLLTMLACRNEQSAPAVAKTQPSSPSKPADEPRAAAYSLSGKPFYAPEPSEKLLKQLEKYQQDFDADPDDSDALIWFGRFTAYSGDYDEAIEIYARGIQWFPFDPRIRRHRGHRLITVRKFDEAIKELETATRMIKGQENQIEPDGMPNEKNIPVSTLHGNIWYHLGLAYYLKQDFQNALRAYEQCLGSSTNADNVVSSTHWLYMIHRRLGDDEAAKACLDQIKPEMDVIENMNYHKCCLFYKGLITLDELKSGSGDGAAGDSISYAIGNWYLYNDELEKATRQFEDLTTNGNWASFGFIAAESDLFHALGGTQHIDLP